MNQLLDAHGRPFRRGGYRRIVSLVPSWTESLFAFGLGPAVVGITDYCVEPQPAVARVPHIGGTKNPRVPAIRELDPDLVIANIEENRRADVEALEQAGIPVWLTDAHTVQQALAELRSLGSLVGADNLEDITGPIEQTYRDIVAHALVAPRPRVFVAIWRDPWMTVNGDTYVGDMIRVCGGENVFEERERLFPLAADLGDAESRAAAGRDTRYPRVSLQEIIARSPELILLPDEPYAFGERDAAEWRAFSQVPAVRDNRVVILDGKVLSWYGVRMGTSLDMLRRVIDGAE